MATESPLRRGAADNPKPQGAAAPSTPAAGTNGDRLVIVMVGLPARGKTYIARKIARYLEFFKGAPSAVFNAGDYRRKTMGTNVASSSGPSHDFFDQANTSNMQKRHMFAQAALDDLKTWMGQSSAYDAGSSNAVGRVGVFDATNTTRKRRRWILRELLQEKIVESKSHILFVENICDNQALIDENIRSTKLRNPDYQGWDGDRAVADFKSRIAHYEERYQPIASEEGADPRASPRGEIARSVLAEQDGTGGGIGGSGIREPACKRARTADIGTDGGGGGAPTQHARSRAGSSCDSWEIETENELSYIKLINSEQVVLNRINGYLQTVVVQFTMNLHTIPRPIYMSRHGQSEYNLLKKIGGDSSLTMLGQEYAHALARWCHEKLLPTSPHARLWTSSLKRTKETAAHIRHDAVVEPQGVWITMRPRQWNALDELHAGIFDGMTYAEIEAEAPDEFQLRRENKLSYRYPRGESYLDVIQRLEPIVQELERLKDPVLIVAHQGILRILYAYFQGMSRERSPYLSVPLHAIKTIHPHAYGLDEEDEHLLQTKISDVPSH